MKNEVKLSTEQLKQARSFAKSFRIRSKEELEKSRNPAYKLLVP